jgi:hypothetical protein
MSDSWVSDLGLNLVAEGIGALVTIFFLNELVKREEQERRRREAPVWAALRSVLADTLESMAAAWTPILPPKDRAKHPPFSLAPRLKEELEIGNLLWPFKGAERPSSADVSRIAKRFLGEASALIALRAMFPNLDDFAEHFVDLATSVDTLRKNAQALERFTEGQSGEQRTKNLYFAENAVVTHAWNVFVFTAKISAQIPEELPDSPTWWAPHPSQASCGDTQCASSFSVVKMDRFLRHSEPQ